METRPRGVSKVNGGSKMHEEELSLGDFGKDVKAGEMRKVCLDLFQVFNTILRGTMNSVTHSRSSTEFTGTCREIKTISPSLYF